MRYEHRLLIGLTGAIGKMGPQSQIITDKIGYLIGKELGDELLKRGLINPDMSYEEIWKAFNDAIEIDSSSILKQDGKKLIITIENCNICPKKVGKYPIPGTACPIGGIFKGLCSCLEKEPKAEPKLSPGEICKIIIA
jgi:predicted hydrocarbon binding protein